MNSSSDTIAEALKSISTLDRVESRLGTLQFDDGAPSAETAALLYDNLDFQHAVQAFLGAIPGVSLVAMRRGFLSAGVDDNSFTLFSELMDSASVFLTGNCDTLYFWGFVDLSEGPVVVDVPSVEAPSGILSVVPSAIETPPWLTNSPPPSRWTLPVAVLALTVPSFVTLPVRRRSPRAPTALIVPSFVRVAGDTRLSWAVWSQGARSISPAVFESPWSVSAVSVPLQPVVRLRVALIPTLSVAASTFSSTTVTVYAPSEARSGRQAFALASGGTPSDQWAPSSQRPSMPSQASVPAAQVPVGEGKPRTAEAGMTAQSRATATAPTMDARRRSPRPRDSL